jgi:hypothetical protein
MRQISREHILQDRVMQIPGPLSCLSSSSNVFVHACETNRDGRHNLRFGVAHSDGLQQFWKDTDFF